ITLDMPDPKLCTPSVFKGALTPVARPGPTWPTPPCPVWLSILNLLFSLPNHHLTEPHLLTLSATLPLCSPLSPSPFRLFHIALHVCITPCNSPLDAVRLTRLFPIP